ncbi:MAG TPA: ABC transporter permease [Conexibacter sp.]|nr:ABC transporter permease [Conexibacter sp.]
MSAFLRKRLLEVIPVLIGITLVAFAIVHLVPGDPAQILLGPRARPAAVADLQAQLGLDRSLPAQYWAFVSGAVTFSFGQSFQFRQPVADVIGPRILPSAFLIVYSLVVALTIAVPLAILSARRRDGWPDQLVRLFTTTTFAMPSFWLGLLLTLVFGLQLGWLPTSGYGDTPLEHFRSLTLPAITVGLWIAAPLLRSLRTNLIDTFDAEFTEAARARGLGELRVLFKHVLRNSLISTVTLMSLLIGVLLSGTVVVESVFSLPGLGSLLVRAVTARDFPVVQTLTLLFGFTVVFVSLATDLLYAVIDPRVRL